MKFMLSCFKSYAMYIKNDNNNNNSRTTNSRVVNDNSDDTLNKQIQIVEKQYQTKFDANGFYMGKVK